MITPTIEEKATLINFINQLFEKGLYDAVACDEDDCEGDPYYEWIRYYWPADIHKGFSWSNGMTKLVLLPYNSRWVIKVDFRNVVEPWCSREARFYQEACDEGLGRYFAATYYLYSKYDMNFFIQERLEMDEEAISCTSNDGYSFYDADDDADRIHVLFEDLNLANKIEDFCYDRDINDLHAGNWGIRSDGTIVVVDYSGFAH